MARPTQLGRYELIHRLGAGGMAEVFLARKSGPMQFEKLVVIKKIHPHLAEQDEFIKMFLREARISALLAHPRIVDMYDLGQVDQTYFIAMEYLAGQPLSKIIPTGVRTRNPLDPLDTARIIADAADGLHAAHTLTDMAGNAKPVIHRDVSPGNIMVLYNGGVKLLDFGIAKARGEITTVGGPVLKGKTGYVSPEQIAGDDIDARSDIFSLGIVLWEALTGRRLFREADDMATLDAILTRTITKPSLIRSEVPAALDVIVLRALNKDREKRFQSARALRIEIENMLWTSNYNREADSIALYMNDVFADKILNDQQLIRDATAPKNTNGDGEEEDGDEYGGGEGGDEYRDDDGDDGDEYGEQVIIMDLDDEDEDEHEHEHEQVRAAGKKGRLPLPAPHATGQVPILGSPLPKMPKSGDKAVVATTRLATAKKRGGIAAGAASSVAAAIAGTAAGAAALAKGGAGASTTSASKPSAKAKRLPTPRPTRADPTPPPIPRKTAKKPETAVIGEGETDLAALRKAASVAPKGKRKPTSEFDEDEETNVQDVSAVAAKPGGIELGQVANTLAKGKAKPTTEFDEDEETNVHDVSIKKSSNVDATSIAKPGAAAAKPGAAAKLGAAGAKPGATAAKPGAAAAKPGAAAAKPGAAGAKPGAAAAKPGATTTTQPTANSQQPTANSQQPTANSQPTAKPASHVSNNAIAAAATNTKTASTAESTPIAPQSTAQLTMAANASVDQGRNKRLLLIAGGCALLVLVIVLVLSIGGGDGDKTSKQSATSVDASVEAPIKAKPAVGVDTQPKNMVVDAGARTATNTDTNTTADADIPENTAPDASANDNTTTNQPTITATQPRRDPAKAKVLFQRGARAFAMGQFFQAKQNFRAAIKANPGMPEPYRGMGLLYKKQKRNGDAVLYLRRYIRRAAGARDIANIKRIIKSLGG